MPINIIEIKAKSNNLVFLISKLESLDALHIGKDHQIDTYYDARHGRLKLREGQIENHLIHYHRGNQSGPKLSSVGLYKSNPAGNLKGILEAAIGIRGVVDKERDIYFIDNVKFHVDQIKGLGTFFEIEAIDESGKVDIAVLEKQCNHYMKVFKIEEEDLIKVSYIDLILDLQSNTK